MNASTREILGRMFILLIRESVSIPHVEFRQAWLDHGLSEMYLPKPRNPQDAFRRATPKKVWKNERALLAYTGGQHLDESSSNEVVMVYSKGAKDKVDIHHINRAIIYLQDGEVQDTPLGPLFELEIAMIDEIRKNYLIARDNIDGTQARNAIQEVLRSVSALYYRDGVYLIPREHFSVADSLTGIVRFMEPYTAKGENVLWDIPYIDTESTRSQIRGAIERHIATTLDTCLKEATTLQTTFTKNVTRSRRTSLITKLADVELIIDTYERMLGPLSMERLSLAGAKLELAKAV